VGNQNEFFVKFLNSASLHEVQVAAICEVVVHIIFKVYLIVGLILRLQFAFLGFRTLIQLVLVILLGFSILSEWLIWLSFFSGCRSVLSQVRVYFALNVIQILGHEFSISHVSLGLHFLKSSISLQLLFDFV
jgi:hypothetical protein